MIERFLKRDYITLFSPDVAGGLLWDLYFRDEEGFRQLYEKLEKDPSVRKTRVKAEDLFLAVAIERFNTGKIYPAFIDNMNNHGSFIRDAAPIKQSNLCLSGETMVTIRVDGKVKQVNMKKLNDIFGEGEIEIKTYKDGEIVWRKVTNSALMNKSAKVMKVKYKGKEVICTPDHKIFTKNRGWVMAKDLKSDDELVVK